MIDTTYFGRNFGVMLFKDAITGNNLLVKYINHETNELYSNGIQELMEKGYEIQAIVCDGRKGLLTLIKDIPVQMCQFHQISILRRYLTRNPKLQAAIELKELVAILTKTDKESFEGGLQNWYDKWKTLIILNFYISKHV